MAPNLDNGVFADPGNAGPLLILSPLPQPNPNVTSISGDEEEQSQSNSDEEIEWYFRRTRVPLEQNLRELLVRVTATEDLESVTLVKLRVIARDLPLQHLGVHIPALRELILDGSMVSTLRDLGYGLKNLKILRVNRCGLKSFDGMLAFEGLQELHAADNSIEDLIPCAFLTNVRVIDLRRNCLKNLRRKLGFLSICSNLEHIHLQGNDEIRQFSAYRQTVKSLLPALKTLDGISFTDANANQELLKAIGGERDINIAGTPGTSAGRERTPELCTSISRNLQQPLRPQINGITSPRLRRPIPDTFSGFTVTFPPKVFLDRPSSSSGNKGGHGETDTRTAEDPADGKSGKVAFGIPKPFE